jgi:hypothetical protein
MRKFAPSVLAFLAGVAWLGLTTTLVPAGNRAPGACTTATMIARLPDIPEASGLAISRRQQDLLWTHNDSGQPIIYAVGTDGRLRARVRVVGAEIDDWEDIATGSCAGGTCLYIADIGDNKASRARIAVYRIPEPAPGTEVSEAATAFYATYPDGPQDAEGFFVSNSGTLFVVTKGEGSPISLYRFPAPLTENTTARLERVATLSAKARKEDRVTDADISADGKWVALRTLEAVDFYRADSLLNGTPAPPVEASLSRLGEPQGEGIALMPDGTVFLTGEGRDGVRGGTLARASCKLP